MDGGVQPAGTRGSRLRGDKPPKSVAGPDGGEGVIEPDAAAPIDAEESFGLACGVVNGEGVAPVIGVLKRGGGVSEVKGAADGPIKARRAAPDHLQEGDEVENAGKADGPEDHSRLTLQYPMFRRFHYGWVNLVVAALAMVATLPGRTQGLGLVTEPLLADWGMDRVLFATVNLWATLFGAVLCLPVGRLTDRVGPRMVITLVTLALGAAVVAMSRTASLPVLFVTLTLTRALGQSALSVVSLALVGKWFARRLNLAMGIFALLVAMGFIGAFPAVGAAVISGGWRTAWLGVGLAVMLLAPVAWLLVRDKPSGGDVEELASQPSDLTLGQALRTPAFWLFALASAAFGLVYSGIALFNQSILELKGFPAETYHRTLVVSTVVGLVCNFGAGWLGQWWPMQRLIGIGMAVLAGSLLGLPLVRSALHVDLYAAAMGAAGGIVTVVFFSVWGQVFGRTYLGRIQGCAQAATVVASAVGPLLLAETLARTGSYDLLFFGLAGVVAMLGIASWVVSTPVREGLLS